MKAVDVAAAIVLGSVGAGLLASGLDIRSDQAPYGDGVLTTATMTDFHTWRSANKRRTVWTTHYRPVYTFTTQAGESMTYADPITVRDPPQLGRTVELSYRTEEPGRARVIRGWHGWTGYPITFALAGTLVLACVVYIAIRNRAERRA